MGRDRPLIQVTPSCLYAALSICPTSREFQAFAVRPKEDLGRWAHPRIVEIEAPLCTSWSQAEEENTPCIKWHLVLSGNFSHLGPTHQ